MSDNALCTPPRLNDSAIRQRLAQFLQETEADPRVGLAIAVVGIDGELIAFGAHARCPALPRQLAQRAKPGVHCAFAARRRDWRKKYASGTLTLDIRDDKRLLAMPGGAPVLVEGEWQLAA